MVLNNKKTVVLSRRILFSLPPLVPHHGKFLLASSMPWNAVTQKIQFQNPISSSFPQDRPEGLTIILHKKEDAAGACKNFFFKVA